MTYTNNARYNKLIVLLHWATVLLFIGVYATIELRVLFEKESLIRDGLKHWHFMLGMTILFVALVRLLLRVFTKTPAITPQPPAIVHLLSTLGHIALYVLMIGMPIAGWLMFSAKGYSVPFYGFEIPPIANISPDTGKQIKEIHELVGNIGYFLIAIHAVAALLHHYVFKDNTLKRMSF